mgnify:CR=1 FL=1
MLVRLLYVSRAVEADPTAATDSILGAARTHNLANGITGILCYSNELFMQVLEGGRGAVGAGDRERPAADAGTAAGVAEGQGAEIPAGPEGVRGQFRL